MAMRCGGRAMRMLCASRQQALPGLMRAAVSIHAQQARALRVSPALLRPREDDRGDRPRRRDDDDDDRRPRDRDRDDDRRPRRRHDDDEEDDRPPRRRDDDRPRRRDDDGDRRPRRRDEEDDVDDGRRKGDDRRRDEPRRDSRDDRKDEKREERKEDRKDDKVVEKNDDKKERKEDKKEEKPDSKPEPDVQLMLRWEVYNDHDAYTGDNVEIWYQEQYGDHEKGDNASKKNWTVNQARAHCEKKNYGGFVVWRKNCYFRRRRADQIADRKYKAKDVELHVGHKS
eukprot:TRINITY_DN13342_c0_g1_i2.p2 TRINITY_DN13342_c0_g1~~TRINITY_DN13342_c0_g1_i2.p2  ORF type:complete len:284 (+),score=113.16 TRINITY_DN13342_c0_g1_i2:93-944(+)